MSQEKRFSDEFLNAFVDNQIAAEEKSRAYVEIHQSEELNRQVCELRKLHDLVQLAYREPPAPPVHAAPDTNSASARLRFGVAASVLLTLGIVLGSQIRFPDSTTQSALVSDVVAPRAVAIAPSAHNNLHKQTGKVAVAVAAESKQKTVAKIEQPLRPVAVKTAVAPTKLVLVPVSSHARIPDNAKTKVLIHLARDDSAQLSQALDEIEGALKHYRNTDQNAHVEVVVNGKGLELVRIDTSEFAGRIQRLQREYDNLTFAACQNTIDRLARDQGIIVQLLPGVITIDSGMAEIMRRQSQGWAYIQV